VVLGIIKLQFETFIALGIAVKSPQLLRGLAAYSPTLSRAKRNAQNSVH